jgi:hypothetical protein
VDVGENPPCVEGVGEPSVVMSGFISGGDGMLETIDPTPGMGFSIVTLLDSIEYGSGWSAILLA